MSVHESDSPPPSRVQDILAHTADISDFLREFATEMAKYLSSELDPAWCAVTLLREKRAGTMVSSAPQAQVLDELQTSYLDGPCLTAIRENSVCRVGDTRDDPRWPDYLPAAAERGVRSILGVAFEVGDEPGTGAALNIYSTQPHSFSDEITSTIRREVHQASSALQLAVRLTRHQETEANLRAAMASRTPIDLAVGIIMGQNRCTQAEAVEILKRASNHRNIKMRDLAEDIVGRTNRRPAQTHYDP